VTPRLNRVTREAMVCCLVLASAAAVFGERAASTPKQFIYFGRERARIEEPTFATNPAIAGAQLRYTWKELEPARDRYNLQPVLDDIASLQKHGKRLFLQIQDASFSEVVPIPTYLLAGPEFTGGADRKLESVEQDGIKVRFDGWVARRWDSRVRDRFTRLLDALGRAVDGRIEGINLAETAIGFENIQFHPQGFTFENYVLGVKALMTAARRAFPRSQVIQYANFMPGDPSGPAADARYLRDIYAHAAAIGVGVGGPDLLPHRRGQQRNSLPLIASRPNGVIAGLAVQDGNLADLNPSTRAPVSVQELYRFATEQLKLDYIFWGIEEPYYSRDVLPFLRTFPSASSRLTAPQ
jgi:hypothetical protein